MLTRGVHSLFKRALFRQTFSSFQEKLLLFPAAQFAIGINVSCHNSPQIFSICDSRFASRASYGMQFGIFRLFAVSADDIRYAESA
jgi:hypothetical protein